MGQTVNLLSFDFGGSNPSAPTQEMYAEIAQLIEHLPSKLGVAGLSPVFRSKKCCNSSVVEHFLGKEEVLSSTLSYSSPERCKRRKL